MAEGKKNMVHHHHRFMLVVFLCVLSVEQLAAGGLGSPVIPI